MNFDIEKGKNYQMNFSLMKFKFPQQMHNGNNKGQNNEGEQMKNLVSSFRQCVFQKTNKSKFKTSKNSRKINLLTYLHFS